MPYKIVKKQRGYKVCKKQSKKCFSKHPITKAKAEKQIKALYASEKVKESKSHFRTLVNELLNEKESKI